MHGGSVMKGRDGVRGGDGTCGRTVAGALD